MSSMCVCNCGCGANAMDMPDGTNSSVIGDGSYCASCELYLCESLLES